MDLIFADETRKDLGVLNSYDFDMAYGKDENDFTCSVDRNDHCCSVGFFIYAEGTEYGGIVDRIKVDTEKDTITYSGRTWHGVLESKVICPDPGEDYLILSGEANEVLQAVFDHIGLSGLFIASDVDTEVEISNYQLCAQPRVCDLAGGSPAYPRHNQPDISESWDGVSNDT